MVNKLLQSDFNKRFQIFLIGFLILFLELSLIRMFSAHIVALSFFSNLVVVASFFGLGIGCLSNSRIDFFKIFPLLFFSIPILFFPSFAVNTVNPDTLMFHSFGNLIIKVNSFYIIPFIFILTSTFFIGLGQKLGKLINSFDKPLDAYIFELAGSILAIICFSLISYLEIDSIFWIIILFVIWFIIIFLDLYQATSNDVDCSKVKFNKIPLLNKFEVFFQNTRSVFFYLC